MARPKKTETEITMQEPAELKIRMTFFEEVLGTASGNPELHDEYIASRNPESPNRAKRITEEVEAIGEGNVVEKQMTIFPKLADGTPFAWDYQIKGMFKECAKMMRYIKGSESSRITNYLQKIDGLIFVKERKIPYQNYKRLGDCQRSLRANTPQGPRVALAHSENTLSGAEICQCFQAHSNFVELPCRTGITAYAFFSGTIIEGVVIGFEITASRIVLTTVCYNDGDTFTGRFGENVFLTKEEAVQALKEREG